ncbi:hypothetical protein KQI65_10050 [bacterium]|nr:hypothetical protein [bacterium]
MYTISLLLLFLFPASGQSSAPELPRIGNRITAAEQAYFELFTGVDGFAHADLRWCGMDSVCCTVVSEVGTVPDIRFDALEFTVLSEWVAQYERFHLSPDGITTAFSEFLKRREDAAQLRAFSRLIMKKIIVIDNGRFSLPSLPTVVTQDGNRLHRPLLAVSDSALFVWDSDEVYDAALTDRYLRRIAIEEIRSLESPNYLPLGPSIVLSSYAFLSLLISSAHSATANEKEHIPVIYSTIAYTLPAVVFGTGVGFAVSGIDMGSMSTTEEDSLAVKRAVQHLVPYSLFGNVLPPEFHDSRLTRGDEMIVYAGDDRHPYDFLPDPNADFALQLGVESLFHVYDVYTRPVSAHAAISLSRRIPLTGHRDGHGWYLAVRPRIAAGSFLTAESCLQLAYPEKFAFNAGLAYTHTFEDLGPSDDGGYWRTYYESEYERNDLLQETFVLAGMTISSSYGNLEFQVRRLLKPAVSEHGYRTVDVSSDTRDVFDNGKKVFWGVSFLLSVRL